MKVGWLHDDAGYIGGAEMSSAEFLAKAPAGVEIELCPYDALVTGCDLYVAHNVVQYRDYRQLEALGAPFVWFHHDLSPWIEPGTRAWLNRNSRHVFCSPMQRDRYGLGDEHDLIPPALDYEPFRPSRQTKRNRRGSCSIAQWRGPGKGAHRVAEWAHRSGESVDVYGTGDFAPQRGDGVRYRGPLRPEEVPTCLFGYERFVFLPSDPEPFGRVVAEAWAAGCKLVVNKLIGALYWIEEEPEKLETAGDDFWQVVEEAAQ